MKMQISTQQIFPSIISIPKLADKSLQHISSKIFHLNLFQISENIYNTLKVNIIQVDNLEHIEILIELNSEIAGSQIMNCLCASGNKCLLKINLMLYEVSIQYCFFLVLLYWVQVHSIADFWQIRWINHF